MKKLVLAVALAFGATMFAQKEKTPVADLKAEKAKKEAELAKLKGEVSALQSRIDKYPGWKFGGTGIIGANFAGFSDWYLSPSGKDSKTGNIGIKVGGFANLDRDKYFWRNSGSLDLGWTKLDPTGEGDADFDATMDVLQLNTLFGYKLTKTLAASAMGTYRTTVIENFNNPGFLDLGVGATWTPMPELAVVAHPLNYNFVFSDGATSYESSLGCKLYAEYNKNFGYFVYNSKFDSFISYEDTENLSYWNWDNTIGFNVWKGIGVSLTGSLRQNKQEAYNNTGGAAKWGSLENSSNNLQSRWMVGLSYGF